MEKPIVVGKIHRYMKLLKKNGYKNGSIPRTVTIDVNNVCNFKCEFCYEKEEAKFNKVSLELDTIKKLADEADELGIWEIILQGGELLVNVKKLCDVLEVLGVHRFRVVLITNGYLLSKETAELLASKGLDCVGISLSTLNEAEHDRSRGVVGAHKKALEAVENSRAAGLTTWLQPIFGHHNSKSQELYDLLEYAKANNIPCYFILAMPYGVWKDSYMDQEDMRIFAELRKKYNCWFDTWDFYDGKKERVSGCWALNRLFVTPKGDVLPCPFINIKVGNIKEQSLKEILEYGFSIKYFSGYSPICIAAQNKVFREKYLQGPTSMFDAPHASEVFDEEDFIK